MSALLVLAIVSVAPALAPRDPQTMVWAGHLDEDGVPVNRTVTISAAFTDDDGADVGAFDDAALVVVDGNFVFDFVLDPGVAPFHANIVINGEDFGDQTFVDTWPNAGTADVANQASRARSADSPVPFTRADFTAGLLPVRFDAVTDLPAAFADGDQGIDLTASARLSFAGNTISLADGSIDATRISGNLVATDFATNAVANVDLLTNGLNNSDFPSTVPLTALAAGTLKARHFSAAQNSTTLFRITNTTCANVNSLSALDTCSAVDNCAGSQRRDCNGSCATIVNAECSNTAVGNLVFK